MSIIYDALKKVEESNTQDNSKPEAPKVTAHSERKLYLLYMLVLILGLFAGNLVFSFLTRPRPAALIKTVEQGKSQHLPEAKTEPAPAATVAAVAVVAKPKEAPKPNITLNGIFYSQDEGYALIDNQILKVGDVVGGATIKSINSNDVELEINGESFKLFTQSK